MLAVGPLTEGLLSYSSSRLNFVLERYGMLPIVDKKSVKRPVGSSTYHGLGPTGKSRLHGDLTQVLEVTQSPYLMSALDDRFKIQPSEAATKYGHVSLLKLVSDRPLGT